MMSYNINRFFLMFIPKIFLNKLPALVTAGLVTAIPYTPMGLIVFSLLFVIIYFTDVFGMAGYDEAFCKFNKPETRHVSSVWSAFKSTYYFYFLIMFIINYNTATQYRMFNTNTA